MLKVYLLVLITQANDPAYIADYDTMQDCLTASDSLNFSLSVESYTTCKEFQPKEGS